MRERIRFVVLAVAVLLAASACNTDRTEKSAGDRKHDASAIGTAWATDHLKSLGGVQGRFRSEVTSRACAQPPTKPCVVGGAVVVDTGAFTMHSDSSSYLHVAFGNGADVTELAGYRVRNTEAGDTFIQPIGGGRSARCWTLAEGQDLGATWDYLPAFDVVNDAEPFSDPPVGKGSGELPGHAATRLVLEYLGASDLDPYDELPQQVPVHLRMDSKGRAAGFWIDGEEVATALVGPPPKSPTTTDPAGFVRSEDSEHANAVREALTPMHADFRMYAFGAQRPVVAPPQSLLLTARGRAQHRVCPGAR